MTRYVLAAMSLLLSGCAPRPSAQSLPGWVLTPEAVYPSDRYLVAVGEGDTLPAAETHALSRLAGRFETRVQSTQQLSDQVSESFGDKPGFERQSGYQSSIHLQTDQTLPNTKTARQFRAPDGRVHVLVLLDRQETARLYDQAIAHNTDRIASLTGANRSRLIAYAQARRAFGLGLENQKLIAQLAIIDAAARQRVSLPYKLEQLRTQSARATAAVRFRVSIQGDRSKPLQQQIRAWMAAVGFTDHGDCDLCVSGTLSLAAMAFPRRDIRTVHYRVLVDIKDDQDQTLLSLQQEGRESHITEQEAFRRAERTIQRLVEKGLSDRLETLVENLAGQ